MHPSGSEKLRHVRSPSVSKAPFPDSKHHSRRHSAQVHVANKRRIPHTFETGDEVLLDTSKLPIGYANVGVGGTSGKLQQRYAGPFTLGRQYSENAFELIGIPRSWRVHTTFNVSRFKPCTIDKNRPQAPPPPLRSS